MRRIWTPSRRRLVACAGGLAMGLAGLTGRADAQAMTEVTFVVVNNLFSTPAFVISSIRFPIAAILCSVGGVPSGAVGL